MESASQCHFAMARQSTGMIRVVGGGAVDCRSLAGRHTTRELLCRRRLHPLPGRMRPRMAGGSTSAGPRHRSGLAARFRRKSTWFESEAGRRSRDETYEQAAAHHRQYRSGSELWIVSGCCKAVRMERQPVKIADVTAQVLTEVADCCMPACRPGPSNSIRPNCIACAPLACLPS